MIVQYKVIYVLVLAATKENVYVANRESRALLGMTNAKEREKNAA